MKNIKLSVIALIVIAAFAASLIIGGILDSKRTALSQYWAADSAVAKELREYVSNVTDPNNSSFIPEKDRIAVFDFDGTLFCETDPNYFDYTLLKYRVLEDPDYISKASDFEKETAEKIKKQNETGESFSGLETDHGKAVASAFSGIVCSFPGS